MNVPESFLSSDYTFHRSSYSCVRGFYFAHIVFNYIIAISGAAAFLSRIGPAHLKWTHRWFGRVYFICMLWSTATSLLIHNTGLPEAVLWSFLWVLSGLCIGWVLIVLHMQFMQQAAVALVEKKLAAGGSSVNLGGQIDVARATIAANKTWQERLFSFKAAHGILMLVSYVNIVGRVLVTPISSDFTCYTYPAFKAITTPHGAYANLTNIVLVPAADPNYSRTPWAKMGVSTWAAVLSLVPLFGAFLIAAIWSVVASRKRKGEGDSMLSEQQ